MSVKSISEDVRSLPEKERLLSRETSADSEDPKNFVLIHFNLSFFFFGFSEFLFFLFFFLDKFFLDKMSSCFISRLR